jgi:hypothetical protein
VNTDGRSKKQTLKTDLCYGFGCQGTLGSDCADIIRIANSTSTGSGTGTGGNPGENTNQIYHPFVVT